MDHTSDNNIILWVEKVEKRFYQIKKCNPVVMSNFIYSVKNRSGPLKILCQAKDTFEEIFRCLVTRYLQGSRGINTLYNLRGVKDSTALDSEAHVANIETFLRKALVVQRLSCMKNATDCLVSSLAEWMFCTMI